MKEGVIERVRGTIGLFQTWEEHVQRPKDEDAGYRINIFDDDNLLAVGTSQVILLPYDVLRRFSGK